MVRRKRDAPSEPPLTLDRAVAAANALDGEVDSPDRRRRALEVLRFFREYVDAAGPDGEQMAREIVERLL